VGLVGDSRYNNFVFGRIAPVVFFIGRGIDERGLDIQLGQPLREEFCHSAVNIALGHDVVARLQQGQDRRGDGAHAGGKGKCSVHTFQFCDSFLRHRVGRISVAGVEVVGGLHAELFLVVGDFERRRLKNRRGQRTVLLLEINPAADSLRVCVMSVLLWIPRSIPINCVRPLPQAKEWAPQRL
jgi:hypothetical protein